MQKNVAFLWSHNNSAGVPGASTLQWRRLVLQTFKQDYLWEKLQFEQINMTLHEYKGHSLWQIEFFIMWKLHIYKSFLPLSHGLKAPIAKEKQTFSICCTSPAVCNKFYTLWKYFHFFFSSATWEPPSHYKYPLPPIRLPPFTPESQMYVPEWWCWQQRKKREYHHLDGCLHHIHGEKWAWEGNSEAQIRQNIRSFHVNGADEGRERLSESFSE